MGTNCIILGQPYTEQMVAGWVGYWTDPAAGYPAVGDRYWMRVFFGATGNTCPHGIADVGVQLRLPAHTRLAVDPGSRDPLDKVRCYGGSIGGQAGELTDGRWRHPADPSITGKFCDSARLPGLGDQGLLLTHMIMAQGQQFWVQVPVVSTAPLRGLADAGSRATATLTSAVNTTAQPFQWVTVFARPPSAPTNPPSQAPESPSAPTPAPTGAPAGPPSTPSPGVPSERPGGPPLGPNDVAIDRAGPRLQIRVISASLRRTLAGRRLVLIARVDEPATVRARLRVPSRLARRLRSRRGLIARGAVRVTRAGAVRLVLRMERRVAARLRPLRRLTARLEMRAVDSAGNVRSTARTVTLRR